MSQPNEGPSPLMRMMINNHVAQHDVAALVRLQLETLEERNKAEAENERLVNLVAYLKEGKQLTKHEDDIRRGLRTK